MSGRPVGFIGLGNMGGPMAANLARAGAALVAYDAAGTEGRAPPGARAADGPGAVAAACDVVVLSLPDGAAVRDVAAALVAAPERRVATVVDTSTIGIAAARAVHAHCLEAGVEYVDAPVSGGRAGAIAATIAVMCGCPEETFERVRPVLAPMAAHLFRVGDHAGMGQAMKLLNNFLSATAMAATAEAVAFGVDQGLDMGTVLEVLNVSSGRNTATEDKFPRRVLTGTYDAGFTSRLLLKDVLLYETAAREAGVARPVSPCVLAAWREVEEAEPNADITRVYPVVAGAARRRG